MTPTAALMMLAGALVGLGVFLLVRTRIPAQPRLTVVIHRLTTQEPTLGTVTAGSSSGLYSQLGARLHRSLGARARGLSLVSDTDLLILGKARHVLLGEKLVFAAIGLALPVIVWVIFTATQLGFPPVIPAGLSLLLAAGGWFLPDIAARDEAREAREEFAAAITCYLDLVAIARVSGSAVNEAMTDAAEVSRAPAFERISAALTRARWTGDHAWEALKNLRDETGVDELGDVADIMRLAGEAGGSVIDTLRARAKGLRTSQMSREHAAANRDTTRMSMPVVGTAVLFLALLAYPAVVALL